MTRELLDSHASASPPCDIHGNRRGTLVVRRIRFEFQVKGSFWSTARMHPIVDNNPGLYVERNLVERIALKQVKVKQLTKPAPAMAGVQTGKGSQTNKTRNL